jgi:hypothetical protein
MKTSAEVTLEGVDRVNRMRKLQLDAFDNVSYGTHLFKIDLTAINRDDFSVKQQGDLVLITPQKSKHRWEADEVHLRSLVTDIEGTVLSSGFPKFVNFGETPTVDAAILEQAIADNLEVVPKLDGSLVILDVIGERVWFRTRGSHDLNEFNDKVIRMIKTRYPDMMVNVMHDSHRTFFKQHSILFEYTSPENRIVLPYDESNLTLLAYVAKANLKVRYDSFTLSRLKRLFGCEYARAIPLRQNLADFRKTVQGLKGVEGFVVRTVTGEPLMVKFKAEEYLLLHSVKFNFNERKVAKLAFLLNVHRTDDLLGALEKYGLDAECVEILRPWFETFWDRLDVVNHKWCRFEDDVLDIYTDSVPSRKEYVSDVQQIMRNCEAPEEFFPAAMKLFDGKQTEAETVVIAYAIGEPVSKVFGWLKNRDQEIGELIRERAPDAD